MESRKRQAIESILKRHGVEIWCGYAVEVYTMPNNGQVITGEAFKPLASFQRITDLYIWLGY